MDKLTEVFLFSSDFKAIILFVRRQLFSLFSLQLRALALIFGFEVDFAALVGIRRPHRGHTFVANDVEIETRPHRGRTKF